MVSISPDRIVDQVFRQCESREYSWTERVVDFVLGYHRVNEKGSDVAFRIQAFGPIEMIFSPDLDVLEIRENHLIGYEVKTHQSGSPDDMENDKLYKGIGQALLLSNQPYALPGGALKHVYLAYPESVSLSDWQLEVIQETHIGVAQVGSETVLIVREAELNPFYDPDSADEFLNALSDEGSGVQSPQAGLMKLAMRIAKSQGDANFISS